jgi:hypothetical protein
VQEILARVGDRAMDFGDLSLGLVPVAAELLLACHPALVAREPKLMLLEAVERIDPTAIAHGDEADKAFHRPQSANVEARELSSST